MKTGRCAVAIVETQDLRMTIQRFRQPSCRGAAPTYDGKELVVTTLFQESFLKWGCDVQGHKMILEQSICSKADGLLARSRPEQRPSQRRAPEETIGDQPLDSVH